MAGVGLIFGVLPERIVGGASAGLLALAAIALFDVLGWWQVPFAPTPFFLLLFYLGLSISLTPIFLVTWRVARRFASHGLAVFLCAGAVIGPPGIRSDVPGVDGVRTGRCSHPRGCGDLCRYFGSRTRRDIPYRRVRQRGPVGESR